MSQTASLDRVLQDRGTTQELDAQVIAAAFERGGTGAAFGLGDGTVRLARADRWTSVTAHDGAVLTLVADVDAAGFLSGGDDGRLVRVAGETPTQLASFGGKWLERVAVHADGKSRLIACAAGKHVHLIEADGTTRRALPHPSTVTSVAFDARGKRVAASHYGGASLWFVGATEPTPRLLEWKGSHLGVVVSPDGDSVVTAMQENALHGWRLSDGQHMRMTGYPAKTVSLGFTRSGKWLATSGAESLVLWPFTGGGPMGKAPTELAGGDAAMVTRVAPHPQQESVATGFSDGLVVVVDIPSSRILPVCGPGRGAVTALAWSASGSHLALGMESGFAAVVDFSPRP